LISVTAGNKILKHMNLFVYGTLMDDDVWKTVEVKNYESSEAILLGYERRKLHGVSYPGIRRIAAGIVKGKVFWDVDVDDLIKLDAFEGDEYCRKILPIKVNDTFVKAFAYELKPEFEHLMTNEEWSLDNFKHQGKRSFLTEFCHV